MLRDVKKYARQKKEKNTTTKKERKFFGNDFESKNQSRSILFSDSQRRKEPQKKNIKREGKSCGDALLLQHILPFLLLLLLLLRLLLRC